MRVYCPYVEILWRRSPGFLREIRRAGFDGVECHLIGRLLSPERVEALRDEAWRLGLEVAFHQGWSWETGQRNLFNRVLRPTGSLLPDGMPLARQVENARSRPVVIYGNHVTAPGARNYLYQTASEHVHGAQYVMPYETFVEEVQRRGNVDLVFDTQHVLEWSQNVQNVAGLPTDSEHLLELVLQQWRTLRSYVSEIQLCDFDPRRGATRGRNVFLGDGIFPLDAFCAQVKQDGWDGVVTPEVAFHHLRGPLLLRILNEKVRTLFA